jgi:hypothetical protein
MNDEPIAPPSPVEPAAAGQVPTLADGRRHGIDRAWVDAERLAGLVSLVLVGALPLALGALLLWLLPMPSSIRLGLAAMVAALALGLALWSLLWPPLSFRHRWYRVAEDHIEIGRGVVWRHLVSVPLGRVQHTDVNQGPIERLFGLAHLVIHTAGTVHASVPLEGLRRERALALRDHLLAARSGDAV